MTGLGSHALFAYALIAWLAAATPGPAVLLALRNGATRGFRAGLLSTLGNQIGLVLLASASILGLGVILHTLPWLFTLVKWIGAAYLVYLGWRMLRARNGLGACAAEGVESENRPQRGQFLPDVQPH
ncbi:LysE family translocator, partial [Hydrogenophaga sp.]|uniref:LysE family translocator n=1 Tax=Hydrogenophaga sp. TaxID=1904254 RepID=UPI003564C441